MPLTVVHLEIVVQAVTLGEREEENVLFKESDTAEDFESVRETLGVPEALALGVAASDLVEVNE